VKGGGISLTPLRSNSRYPKGFITYGPGNVINFKPEEEPNVEVRDGILEISDTPRLPTYMTDGTAGWLAYLTKDNQLFIKSYPVYPGRVYGEMAAGTASIYYFKDEFCEIEPIGPMESIAPGKEISFTERWFLIDYQYPAGKKTVLKELRSIITHLDN
jgi:hypothetical protein